MNWRHISLRRAGMSLLAANLLLSAVPATPFLSSAAPLAWSEGNDASAVDQRDETVNSRKSTGNQPTGSASSVRPRGREAPIDLRQVAAVAEDTPPAVGADPGDGPPPARENEKSARDDRVEEDERDTNIRMWPMPAESYSFTQAFGCVPQIAHFYQPGAGCPADRPVVHTGLDLAAPEGTPFYAAASGWVTESGYDREVGVPNTRIIIQHEGRNDDYATEYLHWIASFVDVGDYVEAGQLIGEVGSVGYSTGPHLHFSLIELDSGEHVDPTRWLPREPGTEGYRGITPRRASMRLPAGTTAGVPEYTDPNPPDAPTREDVPKSADAGRGRDDRGKGKKSRQGEERRSKDSAGNNRQKDSRTVSGKDGTESEDGAATSKDKQPDRERERTRKRERNRDGAAESNDASGEDASGDSRKERRDKSGDDSASGKDDKRASRKDENAVQQTDTRDKGNNRNDNDGGGNNKNRGKDDAQQVAEETPSPAQEAPSDAEEQEGENGSGPIDKDGDNEVENPDGDGDNSGKSQDTSNEDAGTGDRSGKGDNDGVGDEEAGDSERDGKARDAA